MHDVVVVGGRKCTGHVGRDGKRLRDGQCTVAQA